MNCPVLRELELQEACAENEQVRMMTGGDYDITAIRDCGERCTYGGIIYAQRLQIQALERERDRMKTALERIMTITEGEWQGTSRGCHMIARSTLYSPTAQAEAAAAKGEK